MEMSEHFKIDCNLVDDRRAIAAILAYNGYVVRMGKEKRGGSLPRSISWSIGGATMSEKMSTERAAEILNPAHRESYESMEPVNEACRMGRDALLLKIPRSPFPDGDKSILACPNCGSGEYLHNIDTARNVFCGQCGQAIKWEDDDE